MISWILVVSVAIFIFLFIKSNSLKNKIIVIILLVILFLGAFTFPELGITKKDLTSFDGVIGIAKIYTVWLSNIFKNIGGFTGGVFKIDFKNLTNSTR